MERAPQDFPGSKLRDMCKDVGAALLLSPTGEFLLFDIGDPFTFFFKDWEADTGVEVEARFEYIGVDVCNGLAAGDTAFFFVPAKVLSFLAGVT